MPRVSRASAPAAESDAAPAAAQMQNQGKGKDVVKSVVGGMQLVDLPQGLMVKCDHATLINLPEEEGQPCCCLDAVLMDVERTSIPTKFFNETTAPLFVLKSLSALVLNDGREALFLYAKDYDTLGNRQQSGKVLVVMPLPLKVRSNSYKTEADAHYWDKQELQNVKGFTREVANNIPDLEGFIKNYTPFKAMGLFANVREQAKLRKLSVLELIDTCKDKANGRIDTYCSEHLRQQRLIGQVREQREAHVKAVHYRLTRKLEQTLNKPFDERFQLVEQLIRKAAPAPAPPATRSRTPPRGAKQGASAAVPAPAPAPSAPAPAPSAPAPAPSAPAPAPSAPAPAPSAPAPAPSAPAPAPSAPAPAPSAPAPAPSAPAPEPAPAPAPAPSAPAPAPAPAPAKAPAVRASIATRGALFPDAGVSSARAAFMQRAPAPAVGQPARSKGRAQVMQQMGAAAPAAALPPKAGAGAGTGAPAPKPLFAEPPTPPPAPEAAAAAPAASPAPSPKSRASMPAAKRAPRGGVDASAVLEGGGKRARKQVAQQEPPAAVECEASGGQAPAEYKNASRIGAEYNTLKKRMDKIKRLLQPSSAGAPASRAAAKEAVASLKEILGVKSIPSFNDEEQSIENMQEQHAKEIEDLKEAHDEALQTLTEEKDAELEKVKREHAEELQAVKDEAKLAQLKLRATQERLDAAGQERDDALARGYEMGLARKSKK